MKNATVPYPSLPMVQGEPDYHTIHSIRILLHANARSTKTHLVGGALGHLGIIVFIAAYAIVAPAHLWVNPIARGRGPT
jgi:hypothetical protein